MKFIDSHVHFGNTGSFDLSEKLLLDSVEKYRIDYFIVSNLEGSEFDMNIDKIKNKRSYTQIELNKRTVDFVKKNYRKCSGLLWIKPNTEGFDNRLKEFYIENSNYFSGFKIHPYHSRLPVNHKKYIPYFKFAEENKLTVAIHTATDEYSKSEFVYEISRDYPSVNFILVHLDLISDNKNAIKYISKAHNLFGDSTWVKTEAVINAIKDCGSGKILFGSDNPIDGLDTYLKYQQMIFTIRNTFNENECADFFFKNSEKLFKVNLTI